MMLNVLVSAVLLALLPGGQGFGACGGIVQEPPPPSWASEACLQTPVTAAVNGRPLRECLSRFDADDRLLECEDALAEQRVSLFVKKQPVSRVMQRIADALSHGEVPGRQVEWAVRQSSGGKRCYRLARTATGVVARRKELGRPERQAVEWLLALRRFASGATAPADADCPVIRDLPRNNVPEDLKPVLRALAAMSDRDVAELVDRGETAVQVGGGGEHERLRAARAPMPGVFDITRVSPDGHEEIGFTFDTLGIGPVDSSVADAERRRDQASGKPVKLHDPANPESVLMSGDLAEALASWADTTGRDLVAEVFVRERRPLPKTMGTPDELLTAICRAFRCDWRRIGEVTIVWSKTWALDLEADVPDSKIRTWRGQLEAGGKSALAAMISMSELADSKLAVAVEATGAAGLTTPSVVAACRLLGALSPATRAEASQGWVRIARPSQQVLFLSGQLMGHPVAAPLSIWARLAPDGSACVLELTFGDGGTPSSILIPLKTAGVQS